MKKQDEVELMRYLLDSEAPNLYAHDFMNIHRLYFILFKWTDVGLWEYGVNARSGWLTDAAYDLDIDSWSKL